MHSTFSHACTLLVLFNYITAVTPIEVYAHCPPSPLQMYVPPLGWCTTVCWTSPLLIYSWVLFSLSLSQIALQWISRYIFLSTYYMIFAYYLTWFSFTILHPSTCEEPGAPGLPTISLPWASWGVMSCFPLHSWDFYWINEWHSTNNGSTGDWSQGYEAGSM